MLSDYDQLTTLLRSRAGLDLSSYKAEQMQRRVQSALTRMGVPTVGEFLKRARSDRDVFQQFVDHITVNVSEFFRNPEWFRVLETEVLPALLKEFGRLRVWSAGCSYGAEAYSIAMVLAELSPGVKHTIVGTDIDASILQRATQGVFGAQDLKHVGRSRLKRFFVPDADPPRVAPEIRAAVSFRRHNLLSDPFERNWHLVACRNVVIYFTDEAKRPLYQRFFESLTPGGYLFVGATEQVFGAGDIGYEMPHPFFYRKPLGTKGAGR